MFPDDNKRAIEEILESLNGAYPEGGDTHSTTIQEPADSTIKSTVESLLFSNNTDFVKYNQPPLAPDYKQDPVYLVGPTSNQKTFDCAYCCSKETVYADINDNPIIKRLGLTTLALYFKKCKYCKLMNSCITAVEEYLLGSKTQVRQKPVDIHLLNKFNNIFQQDLYNRLVTIYNRTEHKPVTFSKIVTLTPSAYKETVAKSDVFNMNVKFFNSGVKPTRVYHRIKRERHYNPEPRQARPIQPPRRNLIQNVPTNSTKEEPAFDPSIFKKIQFNPSNLDSFEIYIQFSSSQNMPNLTNNNNPEITKEPPTLKTAPTTLDLPLIPRGVTNYVPTDTQYKEDPNTDIQLLKEISESIDLETTNTKNHLNSIIYRYFHKKTKYNTKKVNFSKTESDKGFQFNRNEKEKPNVLCSGVMSNSYIAMKNHCYKALTWGLGEVGLANNNFLFNCIFCGNLVKFNKDEEKVEIVEDNAFSLYKTDLKPYEEDKLKIFGIENKHLPGKYNKESSLISYKLDNLNVDKKKAVIREVVTCNTRIIEYLDDYLLFLSKGNIRNILEKYFALSPANDIRRFLAYYNNEGACINNEKLEDEEIQDGEGEKDVEEMENVTFEREHI